MKKIPGITKTGISSDYWNEYFGRTIIFEYKGKECVINCFKKNPVEKYTEKYSPKEYEGVINKENLDAVKELDEIAEYANKTFKNISTFREKDFKEKINRAYSLIYGQESKPYYKEI